MNGSPARLATAALILAAALSGCSFARSGETRSSDADPGTAVGDGVSMPSVTTDPGEPASNETGGMPPSTAAPSGSPPPGAAEESTGSDGAFEVMVTGRDGRPRSGIRAQVTGPRSFRLSSGKGGVLAYRGPAGHYEIRIDPSCDGSLEVQTSAVGRVAVAIGQTARGSLSVAWRQRYAPAAPVSYEDEDDPGAAASRGIRWPVGETYLVRFAVIDRCSGKPAPAAPFPTWRFRAQPEVRVEPQTIAKANGSGFAFVRLTCTAAVDDIDLAATDAEAADDRVGLFDRAVFDESPPSCVG